MNLCDGCSVFVRVCTEVRLERQPKERHRAERVPCIPPRPFPSPAMFSSRQQRCYYFLFTNHLLPFTIAITARSTPEMWPSIFAKMKVRFQALCTVLLPVFVCARGCVLGGLQDIYIYATPPPPPPRNDAMWHTVNSRGPDFEHAHPYRASRCTFASHPTQSINTNAMQASGLNCIESYVFWNYHIPDLVSRRTPYARVFRLFGLPFSGFK